MMRRMNWSNSDTVNAMSPCAGLQIMPLAINPFLTGASCVTFFAICRDRSALPRSPPAGFTILDDQTSCG